MTRHTPSIAQLDPVLAATIARLRPGPAVEDQPPEPSEPISAILDGSIDHLLTPMPEPPTKPKQLLGQVSSFFAGAEDEPGRDEIGPGA